MSPFDGGVIKNEPTALHRGDGSYFYLSHRILVVSPRLEYSQILDDLRRNELHTRNEANVFGGLAVQIGRESFTFKIRIRYTTLSCTRRVTCAIL